MESNAKYITCAEAAKRLGISRANVYRLLRERRLEGRKVGEKWKPSDKVALWSIQRYRYEREHTWPRPKNGCRRCGLVGKVNEDKLCPLCVRELDTGRLHFYTTDLLKARVSGTLVAPNA